ncbi:MAG: DUF72 domain-containing protein [Acidimicrobiia bacterium]
MTGTARIGCSGWSYRDWRGAVYPAALPVRSWFAWYSDHLDTVELNTTFYRLPTVEVVERWRRQAPPGFLYAVKVGAFGSHRMKLRDPQRWLANHLDRARRLGPALGPNLLQLPPHWRRDVPRLEAFLVQAPSDLRWAVELRDPSWIHDDGFAVRAAHGAALCLHDLLPRLPRVLTTSWTYVRFHGPHAVDAPYRGGYGGRRLWRHAQRFAEWLADDVDVYAYFNNDFGGHAFTDARWLSERLADLDPGFRARVRADPS